MAMVHLVVMGMVALAAASSSECELQDQTVLLQSHAASKEESADSPWCSTIGCSKATTLCAVNQQCCKKVISCQKKPYCSTSDPDAEIYVLPLPANEGCGEIYPGSDCVSATPLSYYSSSPANLTRITNRSKRNAFWKDMRHSYLKDHLFGDHGYKTAGWGGISNYEIVTVNAPNVSLYGVRGNYSDVWFFDEATWNVAGSLEHYANNVALVCWDYEYAIRCDLEQGAELIVGSGSWRNTSFLDTSCKNPCTFKPDQPVQPGGYKVNEIQTANPRVLQHILNPGKMGNVKACYRSEQPINKANLTEAFAHSRGVKIDPSHLFAYHSGFEMFGPRVS